MTRFWNDVDDVLLALNPADRVGRVLVPIVYGGIAALVLVIIMAWPVAAPLERAALITETMALLLALVPIRRGELRPAAWLMALTIIAGSCTVVLSYGSMRTIGSFGFIFALIIAAVFLPRRDIAALQLLVWLAIGWLTSVEVHRAAPVAARPFGWPHAVMLAIGILFVTFVVGYARNVGITAVRKQETALRALTEAEARLRLSMEATRQGWFDLDLRTGVVHSSEQFARIMGATGSAAHIPMTRESWIAAVHRDDLPQVLERFERCLRTGASEQMDYRLMGLDGSFRWIRSMAKVVEWDAQGRPLRMTGTHADISDQRATTAALETSERGYRALVEMSPVGVLVLRDNEIRYANPAAEAQLRAGMTDPLVGADMHSFVPPESREALDRICLVAATTGSLPAEPMDVVLRRLDNERFDANVRCTAVVYEGKPSVQFSFSDNSARKRIEEARLRSRQLEALGTLAGGIAHDFNNILLAIRGNAELVVDDPTLSADGREQLREIIVAGQRASEVVRRITTFASPKELVRQEVALADVLLEVLRLLRPTVPAGIVFDVTIADDVPRILADAAQVHESIVNLTANAAYAIGASRVGHVQFSVDSVWLDEAEAAVAGLSPGAYARLSVTDDGCGMDEATQLRIFDAFYTTKPVGQGSGLGLSMVYGTMRGHGGAITVESHPGQGSTFRLLFRAVVWPAAPCPAALPGVASGADALNVLFVDDEPQLVRLASRTLARAGHHTTTFTDPVEALQAFEATPKAFDVVITDLSMPRLSGLDLARAVRALRTEVPIVLITGYADEQDELAAHEAGVTRLAVKAADAHQLSRLLAEVTLPR